MEAGRELCVPQKAIADTDYDTAVANYKAAKANVAVGQGDHPAEQGRRCGWRKTNLGYTTIKSPVRGVIIDRRVNIGQTVVASLNAPSLFLIAKDLRRMQVWASVNEADIGRIRVGHARAVHRRCLSGRDVSRQGDANPPERHDDAERRHLHGRRDDRQFRRQAAALPDGERAVRGRPAVATCCWCPTRRCDGSREASQIDPTVATRRRSSAASPTKSLKTHGRLWVVSQSGFVRPLEVTVGSERRNDDRDQRQRRQGGNARSSSERKATKRRMASERGSR